MRRLQIREGGGGGRKNRKVSRKERNGERKRVGEEGRRGDRWKG